MENTDAQQLIERYLAGTATPEERLQVETALNRHMAGSDVLRTEAEIRLSEKRSQKAVFAAIDQSLNLNLKYRVLPYAAAAVLFLVGLVFWREGGWKKTASEHTSSQQVVVDAGQILPGGNRATLTLDDGRTFTLDENQNGVIVGLDAIAYGDGSALLSEDAGNPHITYAVLTTPKGGTYQVTLSDGTRVWLNAASTLRYPIKFVGAERLVELQGEAYFEVRKQKSRAPHPASSSHVPFKVKTQNQVVEVLGTGFNISAYAEDAETKTTLVEGSIHIVANGAKGTVLVPGQQATLRKSEIRVRKVEVEQFTAWKEGFFYFDRLSPQSALAQLARWYDLDVVYQNTIQKSQIFGMIDRNKSLGAVLKALEKSGLAFQLLESNGRKQLIVLGEK